MTFCITGTKHCEYTVYRSKRLSEICKYFLPYEVVSLLDDVISTVYASDLSDS